MSQSKLIRLILQHYIETSKCFLIISKDGITTDQFAIAPSDLLFVNSSISIRDVRLKIPSIITTVSVAKNLDYYQNKICNEIPSIPDIEHIKSILQKLRIIIIALFVKLNRLMIDKVMNASLEYNKYLVDWNKYSEKVLIATSTILIGYQQGKTEEKIVDTIKETLDYLDISMSLIDEEMSNLY
ncbi:MAG TPA: hypothetical protein VJ772_01485 [Nitrososphaeraceae archaeon]|nr:hypothetical protein [Nitrososphaeraceae archaeon]